MFLKTSEIRWCQPDDPRLAAQRQERQNKETDNVDESSDSDNESGIEKQQDEETVGSEELTNQHDEEDKKNGKTVIVQLKPQIDFISLENLIEGNGNNKHHLWSSSGACYGFNEPQNWRQFFVKYATMQNPKKVRPIGISVQNVWIQSG